MNNQHVVYGYVIFLCVMLGFYIGVAVSWWFFPAWLLIAGFWGVIWYRDWNRNGRAS